MEVFYFALAGQKEANCTLCILHDDAPAELCLAPDFVLADDLPVMSGLSLLG